MPGESLLMRRRAVPQIPKVLVSLDREAAAALLTIAVSYGASGDHAETEIAKRLDRAIQPLRDVVPYEEAQEADELLKELWGDAASG